MLKFEDVVEVVGETEVGEVVSTLVEVAGETDKVIVKGIIYGAAGCASVVALIVGGVAIAKSIKKKKEDAKVIKELTEELKDLIGEDNASVMKN